ncbi:MAG TPA: alpha/beta hydrolase [Panacibacter sp.]|nr:alpha/beta hydrolase [Panacibacter sp.]HNP45741.1 alpha/beta hydrolase [Panacibacter sp.]
MKKFLFVLTCFIIAKTMNAQKVNPIYDGTVPNSKPCEAKQKEFIDTSWNKNGILIVQDVTVPTVTVFEARKDKRNGAAVVICPGGGYSILAAGHEGNDFAMGFAEVGVTAFVLRYRLPNDACMTNKAYVPLMDAQQAIYYVRKHAQEYGIDTNKVGIMGFSAGGHLAASAEVHFNDPVRKELAGENLRPDFAILGYPVISFREGIGHMGSRDNLIGKTPTEDATHYFSNEEQVTAKTPPTFLVHASDDAAVIPDNSILFYQALVKNKVPAELHIYERGGHGFGMVNPTTKEQWFKRCLNWMKSEKLIPSSAKIE